MIRVLVVICTSFVEYGGLTTVAMNYYRKMNREGLQTDFASTNQISENLEKELKENGSVYYRLPNRIKKMSAYYHQLKKIASGYDVIHVHANSATAAIELSAAKDAGVSRRIVHIHTSNCDHRIAHILLKPFFDRLYTDAVACSKTAGSWVFKDNDFTILNNAVDVAKFCYQEEKRAAIRVQYGIKNDVTVIGHVGKIYEPKNHLFLVDIFEQYQKRNPESLLLLVGDGVLRQTVEQRVIQKGLSSKVIFAGMQKNVADYLSAFDLFLFPSKWEGMPLSVIEALSSGLRCLVSDRVTEEVNVTENVSFLSIDKGTDTWTAAMEAQLTYDRKQEQAHNVSCIQARGYDVKLNAERLRGLYLE